MEFYAPNGMKRPIRLSEETRIFAYESLNHKYGLDTKRNSAVSLDDIPEIDDMSALEKYDTAIAKICAEAPIRICDHERISGSATLGLAIDHCVPATIGGNPVCSSISHLTIDFESVLKYGIDHIRNRVTLALIQYADSRSAPFLRSCMHCLNAFDVWHSRYLDALRDQSAYAANYEALTHVPHKPARNFREAVQSLWFVFAFVRLCGNWPGIGRIDWLLGSYLKNDLQNGVLTLDEAREILSHFFIKGCEWICGGDYGSGDAQHYQNIVLAGVDENGKEVTNEVTYLVLDILEEFGISDFPTTVRLNAHTDGQLLRRIAEVLRFGGGILAFYNEDLIIDAMVEYGYDLHEARKFANDGCWEVQIPGKTRFTYAPFDGLNILQHDTLADYSGEKTYKDFEMLYRAYISDLAVRTNAIIASTNETFAPIAVSSRDWKWDGFTPCTIVSLFEQGCIENGRSYLTGGCVYNVQSPHIGGLPDVVNSLYAIKKLVFDEKRITFSNLMFVLRNNWENAEPLRQYVKNRYAYYGNDSDEVDELYARIVSDYAEICNAGNGKSIFIFPGGVSTFGRQLAWAPQRLATPYGRKAGEILAANDSPTPGTDKEGATAIIRSYCKADLKKLPVGAALDLKLLPSSVNGETGLDIFVSLMRSFVSLGGFFMQPDVTDASILREAQENPDNYQTLSVRVSGWNARFVTLNREWQDMVIAQTEQGK